VRGDGRKAGRELGERAQNLDEPAVGAHVDERLLPTAVEHGQAEGQVVEQLVGHHNTLERPWPPIRCRIGGDVDVRGTLGG